MTWCAVDVRTPAAEREAVVAWLVERTGQAVEERADGVLVGATESAGAPALLADLSAAFGARVAGAARVLPEVDWRLRWRDGLAARRVGRLLITPSWIPAAAPESAPALVPVIIDPETAFGTAEHGSTRTALALLEQLLSPGDRMLDLGSGSGILAIAAARLGAARAVGVDCDPEVEAVALANAGRNGVAERVRFLTGDAGELAPLLGPAEVVASNILRSVNQALLPAIRAALTPTGVAIFAGIEHAERTAFLATLERERWSVIREANDDGWWSAAARPR